MPIESVLAIDTGTQTTRAALVSADGSLLDMASSPLSMSTPRPGWAEQEPERWWSATVDNVSAVMSRNPGTAVAAVAACGQMHGVVALDKAGRPLAPRVGIWCDKRAEDQVARFLARPDARRLSALAANVPLPAWAGFKMAWYCEEEPDLYQQAKSFLVVKDFLNLRLCGERATDPTEASGTFLVDAGRGRWSPELIDALGLDENLLPPIAGSGTVIGGVLPEVAAVTGLRAGTPVVAGAGDMLCQLYGVGLSRPGRLAEVAGTASIVAAYSEQPDLDDRVMSLRTVTGGWVNFGITDGAGACMNWLAQLLSGRAGPIAAPEAGAQYYTRLEQAAHGSTGDVHSGHGYASHYASIDTMAATAPAGANGLLFFPYVLGERTLGSTGSRASFIGLTLTHDHAHMARAVMEGICFENRRALDLLARPTDGTVLRCTGGGSRSALWNQLRADIYERPVRSFATVEGGVHGAAMLAAVGAGWYASTAEAADNLVTPGADWQPRASTTATYRAGYESFRAVHDALDGQWKHWAR